jgi:hypothetical protein
MSQNHAPPQRSALEGQDMAFLFDAPSVFHCHHFNLFHDQTIDDALGEEHGGQVRRNAAQSAFRPLLENLMNAIGAETPAERVAAASKLFANMGHGKLDLDVTARGGRATGAFLHYGYSWREKYGSRVRRSLPVDSVAEGFAAAAAEVALRLAPGTLVAKERDCLATKHQACTFEITPRAQPLPAPTLVDRQAVAAQVPASFNGVDDDRIQAIAKGLRDFLAPVSGDARGLVQAFNVFITMHLSNYYCETVFESMRHLERTVPAHAASGEALFSEAGTMCVFNTFGNILLSPEWEGLVGPVSGKPEDIVSFSCAIARGLGFGRWCVQEFEPHRRLVLRAPSTYETPFYSTRYGRSDRPRCYVFQGAVKAIAALACDLKWAGKPRLDDELYQQLLGARTRWRFEQTRCPSKGDPYAEVIATAR